MNKNVVIAIVIVIVLGAIGYALADSGAGSGVVTAPIELEGADDARTLVELGQGITKGDPDAPITIVEFADFQCPACQAFASQVKPQVELAWVESGQAKFVFYDFPITTIHPHAFLAARAGRCANDQGMFWEYHDALFRNQSSWSGSPRPPVGTFEDYAAEVGLDQDDFSDCLRSDRHADVVTANMLLGQQLGVGGTPTVMVSAGEGMARRTGDASFPTIQRQVEALLAARDSQPSTGGEGGTP